MSKREDAASDRRIIPRWMVFLFGFAGLFAIALTIIYHIHAAGFCIAQLRYLGKDQFVDAAVLYQLKELKDQPTFDTPSNHQNEILTQFSSVQDFKMKNPTCCAIVNDRPQVDYDWFTSMIGAVSQRVLLKFDLDYKSDSREVSTLTHSQEIPVSSCGEIEVKVFRNSFADDVTLKSSPTWDLPTQSQ